MVNDAGLAKRGYIVQVWPALGAGTSRSWRGVLPRGTPAASGRPTSRLSLDDSKTDGVRLALGIAEHACPASGEPPPARQKHEA